MFKVFLTELQRIGVFFLPGFVTGLLIGNMGWCLLISSCFYISWILVKLHQLNLWLTDTKVETPEAGGIWGIVFDKIYQLKRQHEKEKAELQAIINRVQEISTGLKDGLIILNAQDQLDFWNPAAHRILGLHIKDRGQHIINFLRDPKFVSYFDENNYSEPIELLSPRFSSKYLQLQITPFGNKEKIILIRDVTRLHNLEKMRQDFIANVSHELRTPLTVISGYLETLVDNNENLHWQKPLQQMTQQARRMSLLINDLLTLSKLETTEADHNHKPVNIEKLLASVKMETDILAQEKQQQLTLICNNTSKPLLVKGNEKELHSAISNLVINAIKYTQSQGRINILLWQDLQHFYISVTDNGPGIEAQHLPRITERFYRLDSSRNSETGGTGLGLAIVKHILLRHYAELKVTSEPGKGSSFTCVFGLQDR